MKIHDAKDLESYHKKISCHEPAESAELAHDVATGMTFEQEAELMKSRKEFKHMVRDIFYKNGFYLGLAKDYSYEDLLEMVVDAEAENGTSELRACVCACLKHGDSEHFRLLVESQLDALVERIAQECFD